MSSGYVQFVPILIGHFERARHLYSTNPDRTPPLQHMYYLCRDSSTSINVLSVHHLSYLYPVSTPSLLLTSSQDTIYTPDVQSIYHLYSPCPDSTWLDSPYPVSNISLQPMPRQYPISMANTTEVHLSLQCEITYICSFLKTETVDVIRDRLVKDKTLSKCTVYPPPTSRIRHVDDLFSVWGRVVPAS